MTMFETRILCNILPRSINNLDKLIPSNERSLTSIAMENNTNSQTESHKNYRRQIRDNKREMLLETLANYETVIEENEYLYQEELLRFEYELSKHTYTINHLMTCINHYLNHRTDRIIREIRYKEAIFRMK